MTSSNASQSTQNRDSPYHVSIITSNSNANSGALSEVVSIPTHQTHSRALPNSSISFPRPVAPMELSRDLPPSYEQAVQNQEQSPHLISTHPSWLNWKLLVKEIKNRLNPMVSVNKKICRNVFKRTKFCFSIFVSKAVKFMIANLYLDTIELFQASSRTKKSSVDWVMNWVELIQLFLTQYWVKLSLQC